MKIFHLSVYSKGSLASFYHKQGMMCSCHFWYAKVSTSPYSLVEFLFDFSSQYCKHLNLPKVWSSQTYTHARAPRLTHLLTNSSRQYHLLIHFSKQILSMKKWLNCCKISLLNPCMLSPKVHEHCDYIPRQAKWDGDSWQCGRLSFHLYHPCGFWHNLQGPRPVRTIHLSLTLEPMLGFCHREVVLSTSLYMY